MKAQMTIKSPKMIKSGLTLLVLFILTGCNANVKSQALNFSETEQLKQLASLVVGAKFLKTKCGVATIPNDNQLIQKSLQLGRDKGWNVNPFNEKTTANMSRLESVVNTVFPEFLKEVENDPIEVLQMKCDEYNELLADFRR